MADPKQPALEPPAESAFVEIRYSLPALLAEVQQDRASTAFVMEKLDQATINTLFEARRDASAKK